MRIIVSLILIALLQTSRAQTEEENVIEEDQTGLPGGWTNVDLDEVNNSEEIQGLLKLGAERVIKEAIEDLDIPDSSYQVTEITQVTRQVVNGLNYNFVVKLDNSQGTVVYANYFVYYQPSTNTRRVTSWRYRFVITDSTCSSEDPRNVDYEPYVDNNDGEQDVNEESGTVEESSATVWTETDGAANSDQWSVVNPDAVNSNPLVKELFDRGIEATVRGAIRDGEIPDSDYVVTEVYRVTHQVQNGDRYKFHVELDNGLGTKVKAIFVVFYQSETGRTDVTCYNYYWTQPRGDRDVDSNEEEYVAPEEWVGAGSTGNEGSDEGADEEPADEEIASSEEEAGVPGGWFDVGLDEVEGNEEIQDALDFGAQYVIQQGVLEGKVPDSNFEVVEIYSVEGQVVSGWNYKFNIKLENGDGVSVIATFVVYDQPWLGTKEVTEYQYDVVA